MRDKKNINKCQAIVFDLFHTLASLESVIAAWPERIPEREQYADHEIDKLSSIIELLNGVV